MIQRKQTLWFFLSALVAALAFVLPFGFKNTTSISSYQIDIHDFFARTDIVLMLLFGGIIVLNLLAIFLFNKRPMQVNLAVFIILLCIAALGYEVYFSTMGGNSITFGIANATLYIGMLIPFVSMVFTFMAMSAVKRDIKLLRETARLR